MRLRELYTGNNYYSYVAFSYADAEETEALLDALDAGGYRYWLNAKIAPNEKDLKEILERLRAAAVTVLVFTENAINDRIFNAVVQYSLDNRTPIVVYIPTSETSDRGYLNSILEKSINSVVYRVREEGGRFSNSLKAMLSCTKGIPVSDAKRFYENGIATLESKETSDEEKEQAVKDINFAASSEYPPALNYLGDRALQGARMGLIPYSTAIMYYKRAMKYGDINSVYTLGCMIADGEGFGQNYSIAHKYISIAAMAGIKDAPYRFAEMLDKGLGVPKKHDESYAFYKKALDSGDRRAYLPLAHRYLVGDIVPRNETVAAEYFQEAANDGSVEAMLKLGELYRDGVGVSKNLEKAEIYFKRAADKGIAEAQYQYALILRGKKKDSEAFSWLRHAAKEREYGVEPKAEILYELAQCYCKGQGVAQDNAAAFMYYHRAAQLGHGSAAMAVAECYRHGIGVAVNKRAADYYTE